MDNPKKKESPVHSNLKPSVKINVLRHKICKLMGKIFTDTQILIDNNSIDKEMYDALVDDLEEAKNILEGAHFVIDKQTQLLAS